MIARSLLAKIAVAVKQRLESDTVADPVLPFADPAEPLAVADALALGGGVQIVQSRSVAERATKGLPTLFVTLDGQLEQPSGSGGMADVLATLALVLVTVAGDSLANEQAALDRLDLIDRIVSVLSARAGVLSFLPTSGSAESVTDQLVNFVRTAAPTETVSNTALVTIMVVTFRSTKNQNSQERV